MSALPQDEPVDAHVVDEQGDDLVETVDGEPVLDDADSALTPARIPAATLAAVASPAVQAAAAAATGFVAGAATLAIVHRRGARRSSRAPVRRRGGDALPILGTRSFLVDIHVLGGE